METIAGDGRIRRGGRGRRVFGGWTDHESDPVGGQQADHAAGGTAGRTAVQPHHPAAQPDRRGRGVLPPKPHHHPGDRRGRGGDFAGQGRTARDASHHFDGRLRQLPDRAAAFRIPRTPPAHRGRTVPDRRQDGRHRRRRRRRHPAWRPAGFLAGRPSARRGPASGRRLARPIWSATARRRRRTICWITTASSGGTPSVT